MNTPEQKIEPQWAESDTEIFAKYGDFFVPDRALQMGTVVDLLSDLPDGDLLDICCGEGRLTERYLEQNPGRRAVLMDGSDEMLSKAEKRLHRFEGRTDRFIARIQTRDWREPNVYAGIASSLAIHHLDGEEKKQLFRDVFAMLKPGGAFVIADLMEAATTVTRAVAGKQWHDSVASTSRRELGSNDAIDAFVRADWNYYRLTERDTIDKPSTVYEQLRWLDEAGFVGVDLVWMLGGHAILTGRKPV